MLTRQAAAAVSVGTY